MTRNTRRRTATPDRLSDEQIIEMTAKFEELKGVEAAAKKEAKALQDQILKEMGKRGVEVIEWNTGRVTRTAAKRLDISIDVLRELLPTRIFNRVTSRQVDKTLLSAAVQDRTISADLVASATTESENAPYIRVSHGTGD
jgi:hypothetical protein